MTLKTHLTGIAAAVILSTCTAPATQQPPVITGEVIHFCEISRDAGYGHCNLDKAEALMDCKNSSEACRYFAQQNYDLCADEVKMKYGQCMQDK